MGRAVHGVLQSIDLTDGAGIDDAILAQCVAEGVLSYADVVRGLVSSALASPVVRRAAARGAWRESWVATVEDDPDPLDGGRVRPRMVRRQAIRTGRRTAPCWRASST